ncbi:hypothetical protein A3A60_04825 [Candidatus Curtissbacteria bacterium RIFCSPLOWO2_01_FULL_42_26]|uniref:Uncharacterized protein n=1 Tax=Candidatus Curtissbacteria bacterium RIFCSPLOWO2_01_FULL_42_26 TaxID=1797729 RepID=A0A1F5I241_9BACT|nr:MAG: hypothetical protein A3A60_04825 [Candidatus Curtissbacteria bacterium RIFCSPLOWO2_01_FULL_42_26]
MKILGRGKDGGKKPAFEPNEAERILIEPLLTQGIDFADVKESIFTNPDVPEDHRELLLEWYRDRKGRQGLGGERRIEF